MQILKKIYRSSYAGENVVTNLTLEGGEWNPETEYVSNAVTNTHTTTQGIAIANGPTRYEFELRHIANHTGGLFGVNKLQSYGCNSIYKDFAPDFLVAVNDDVVTDLANSSYPNDNIVYSSGANVLAYPGKFYLIPQNVSYDAGAIAAYMACFDGHSKVYLMGYDSYTVNDEHNSSAFWLETLLSVIKTYNDVDFVRVMPTNTYSCAEALMSQPNFRQITFREFVLEADIG